MTSEGSSVSGSSRKAEIAEKSPGSPKRRAMKASTWFVSGANRGVGLEYVQQLLSRPNYRVAAAAREPHGHPVLQNLKTAKADRLMLLNVDITDKASVKEAAGRVDAVFGELDYLINGEGVAEDKRYPVLQEPEDLLKEMLKVNALGPYILTRELVPVMRKGSHKTIINLSSAAASLTLHSKEAEKARPAEWAQGHLGYKASKAALNAQTAVLANALKHEGFVVVSMHPGWVGTELGKHSEDDAPLWPPELGEPLSVEGSVNAQLGVIRNLRKHDTGRFLKYDGSEVPW